MKIFIDTNEKIIEIEEEITLGNLIKDIEKLVGESWKKYKIRNKYKNNFIPITINEPCDDGIAPPYPQITYKITLDNTK